MVFTEDRDMTPSLAPYKFNGFSSSPAVVFGAIDPKSCIRTRLFKSLKLSGDFELGLGDPKDVNHVRGRAWPKRLPCALSTG